MDGAGLQQLIQQGPLDEQRFLVCGSLNQVLQHTTE
jgi:hypothetical protein